MVSNIFNLKKQYYFSYTPKGLAYMALSRTVLLAVTLMSCFVWPIGLLLLLPLLIAALMNTFRSGMITSGALHRRNENLRRWAASTEGSSQESRLLFHAMQDQAVGRTPVLSGNGWRMDDDRQVVQYRLSDDYSYDGEHRYTTKLEMKLPRNLPHIVFRSKTAEMSGEALDAAQIASLEGNFDDHFTTYFPKHYHIDARSVISPDVMHALIALADCSIDISDDIITFHRRLVLDTEAQDFIAKCFEVYRTLADHIVNYRDERLESATNRSDVSPVGRQLRKSVWPSIGLMVGGSVAAGLLVVSLFVNGNSRELEYWLWTIIGIMICVGIAVLGYTDRRKIIEEGKYKDALQRLSSRR